MILSLRLSCKCKYGQVHQECLRASHFIVIAQCYGIGVVCSHFRHQSLMRKKCKNIFSFADSKHFASLQVLLKK